MTQTEVETLKRAKASLDIRLNDHLCKMKEGHDDSVVGFNEAWSVVHAFFDERLAAPHPSQLPTEGHDQFGLPWHVEPWGDGSKPPYVNICSDSHGVVVAADLERDVANWIVSMANAALTPQGGT